jgi:cytochrome c
MSRSANFDLSSHTVATMQAITDDWHCKRANEEETMRLTRCFGYPWSADSHGDRSLIEISASPFTTHGIAAQASRFTLILLLALGFACPASAAAVNAAAAEALMVDSGCNKCHKIDKKKDGPAYRDVAAKYRGKPDAEEKITFHVTSGEMVKFDDGHEEEHKKVKAKNSDDVKNLVNWILSLEGGKKY